MSAGGADGPLIYLTAGEPSGDQIGAYLMQALKELTGGKVRFAGVGGPRMAEEGLESLFPMAELTLMGLEFLPRLPALVRRIGQTADHVRALRPAALVMIDAQGFSKRVGRAVAKGGAPCPIIQYVAPTVWAWKPWRARAVSRYLDHLLTIFPFEAPFFDRYGLPNTFVGHLAAEQSGRPTDGEGLRARFGIAPGTPVICALPGSRRGEVWRHLPVIGETLGLLKQRLPGLVCLVPTVSTVADAVEAATRDWPVETHVIRDPHRKYDAFAASTVALAASGTVTSETSFAGLPTVVLYRINPFAAQLLRYVLKTKWIRFASAVNLVVDRAVLPEFLQERCRADLLADAVYRLVNDAAARSEQLAGMAEARDLLSVGGERPSRMAARTILDVLEKWRKAHVPGAH